MGAKENKRNDCLKGRATRATSRKGHDQDLFPYLDLLFL